ncbi:MAG: hypothetical protein DCC51_06810 [Anaerolineae bacterium]|nr:MAG: hypothetical protein DCC51_06810 [Anaerolineae bacterium]
MEKQVNMNDNETIVIASFADDASAEAAIEKLREWDKRVRDVKLGMIGLVRLVGGVTKSEVVYGGGIFKRSMPISDEATKALAQELGDRIGVVVACDDYEASMVSDALVRDGGKILVNTYERTAEEKAKELKNVEAARMERSIDEGTGDARSNRNIVPPV